MTKKRILRALRLDKIAAVDNPCQEGATMAIMKRHVPGINNLNSKLSTKDLIKIKQELRESWEGKLPEVLKYDVGPRDIAALIGQLDESPDEYGDVQTLGKHLEEMSEIYKAASFKEMMALQNNQEAMEHLGEKFAALRDSLWSVVYDTELGNKRMAAHESLNEFHESVLSSLELQEVNKRGGKKMPDTPTVDELIVKVDDLTKKLEDETTARKAAEDKVAELSGDGGGETIDKSKLPEPVRKALEQAEADRVELRKQGKTIEKMQQEAILKGFIKKAEDFGNLPIKSEELGQILKAANENLEKDLYKKLEEMLIGANNGMEGVFKQQGGSNGTGETALEKLNSLATEIAKRDGVTKEVAFTKAMDENPELNRQHYEEKQAVRLQH